MTFPLVKPGGFGLNSALSSADMNKFDQHQSLATDGRKNPDELPALNFIRKDGVVNPGGAWRDIVWDPVLRKFVMVGASAPNSVYSASGALELFPAAANLINGALVNGGENNGNVVILNDDDGDLWVGDVVGGFVTPSTPPTAEVLVPVYCWDTGLWIVEGHGGTAFYSNDDGNTWVAAATPPTIDVTTHLGRGQLSATNGTRVLRQHVGAGTPDLWWTDDGDVWNAVQVGGFGMSNARFAWHAESGTWIACINGNAIAHSTDNGLNWGLVTPSIGTGNASTFAEQFGFVAGVLLLVPRNTSNPDTALRIWGSDDLGVTWAELGVHLTEAVSGNGFAKIFGGPFAPNMFITATGSNAAPWNDTLIHSLRPRISF